MLMFSEWVALPFKLKAWTGFLILFPFYFFSSGLPQIADWLLAILLISELLNPVCKLNRRLGKYISPLLFLTAYSFFITFFWLPWLDLPTSRPWLQLLFPVFFLYNTLVVRLCFYLYQIYGVLFIRATVIGFALAIFIQVILLPISYSSGIRGALFFNNPNQLGYYSLLFVSCLLVCEGGCRITPLVKAVLLTGGTLLALISNSKAAMISSFLLIPFNLLATGVLRFQQLIGAVGAIALIVILAQYTDFGKDLVERAKSRIEDVGSDSDDSMELRGYDRIWENPEHLVFGAGEGGWARFYTNPKRQYEMHSTFGTLVFSYGVPGSLAFLVFLWRVLKGGGSSSVCYTLPCFAYGLTHMGLRFTLFWVFLALIAIMKESRQATPK